MTGTNYLAATASWYAYAAWCALRQMWDDLPGPWWVKVLLTAACLAIPGCVDEIALLALIRGCRVCRARIARKRAQRAEVPAPAAAISA